MVFPTREPGVSGHAWGSQEGCQGPFRPSGHAQGVSGPSSSCVWNPRVFADDARGWQCPFVLCLHPQGCLRRGPITGGSPPGCLRLILAAHEVRQGAQGASLMAPGKSGLHVRGERVRVISIEPWKQIRASRRFEEELSRSFSGCGRKPWVPSTCASDLMELLRVPLTRPGSRVTGGD